VIHLLAEYCRKQNLVAEPGFGPKFVRWAICCDADGRYTGLVELGDVGAKNNRGQEFPCCPDLSQGELIGGGGSRSHFLADTAKVVLLLSKTPAEPGLSAKNEFFRELLRRACSSIPALAPIVTLLDSRTGVETIRTECERRKVKPTDRVTFRIESVVPLDQDSWHAWWREFRRGLSGKEGPSGPRRRCFVTGELTKPERTDLKINRLADVGGQPAGDVLIGFDKDAFCSFGFSQAENASVSAAGMTGYRSGLNELLEPSSSVRVGNARVAFWFKERVEDLENPLWALLGPGSSGDDLAARQRAIDFLRSVHTGRIHSLEGNRYYALTLSGAGGRVMVRGWMEGSFESLASAIACWFDDLRITSLREDFAPPPSLDHLSYNCLSLRGQRSNEQKQTDNERRRLGLSLFHSALTGARLSDVLPLYILSCLRSELSSADTGQEEAPLQPNRFAVLRAYLVRFFRERGDISMSDAVTPALNPAQPSSAYHCGRILAILAALQKRALGPVGAGVIQRYYASASTNPGLVFGRLIRNAQYHIDKLGPDKSRYLESLLAQTSTSVRNEFPKVLSLQEQGLFGLGYYHQIADLRKKRIVTDDTGTPQEEVASDDSAD